MESFSRGWSFLQQAWQMAFKDKDLIKPSIYALIVGSIVSVIGSIPIFVGLAVIMPIFGHATWHLYRKMVEPGPRARTR